MVLAEVAAARFGVLDRDRDAVEIGIQLDVVAARPPGLPIRPMLPIFSRPMDSQTTCRTFASWLKRRGVDSMVVARLMGHTSTRGRLQRDDVYCFLGKPLTTQPSIVRIKNVSDPLPSRAEYESPAVSTVQSKFTV